MRQHYKDIRNLIDIDPLWFDEAGVPRYQEFDPSLINGFADEVIHYEIACQNCGKRFNVCSSARIQGSSFVEGGPLKTHIITNKRSVYGYPPNVDCCENGPKMLSIFIQVFERWVKATESGLWIKDKGV